MNNFSVVFGGGDGSCSQVVASTSPLFKEFTANMTELQEKCLAELSSLDNTSADFEKNIEDVYNECTSELIADVSSITEKVALAVKVPSEEVGSAILVEGIIDEPLSCISSKLLKIYPLLTSTVDILNAKVTELLAV